MRDMTVAAIATLALASAGAAELKPVWTVKEAPEGAWTLVTYCDSSFMRPVATNVFPQTALVFDMVALQPRENADPRKGPVFYRRGLAYSASAYLDVPETAEYVFSCSNAPRDVCAARLAVDGRMADEFPGSRLRLCRGRVRLDLWIKDLSSQELRELSEKSLRKLVVRHVLWKRADGASGLEYARVTPAPAPADPAPFDTTLDLSGGRHVYFGYRTYDLDVPEDGYYEIGLRTVQREMASTTVSLDGREILFRPIRGGLDTARSFLGNPDTSGRRRTVYKADWFGRAVSRRWVAKGRHTVDVKVSATRTWFDDMPRQSSNRFMRVGWRRLPGVNPEGEAAFWFEDRDSMVFERGEPLELAAGCPVEGEARDWTMEVWAGEFPTNGVGAPVWRETRTVGGARTRFSYPCDREGVFEYVLRNGRGEVTDGPWSFVVIDSTPLPVPRLADGTGAGNVLAYGELVDSVDFGREGLGGEHLVRDNGTSFAVTNAGCTYRATGPAGHMRYACVPIEGRTGEFRLKRPGEKPRSAVKLQSEDWFAFTFRVRHPGRAHVVRAWIPNDADRTVALYAPDRMTGDYSGWLLHAGGDVPAAGRESPLTFMVWPNTDAIDLLCVNATYDAQDKQGAIIRAELFECPEGGLAPLAEAANGWVEGRDLLWTGEQMDLGVNERTMPGLKGFRNNWIRTEVSYGHAYHSWADFLSSWTRLGNLSAATGNNLHQASIYTYAMRCYRGRAERLVVSGQDPYACHFFAEDVDPFDRDVFALMLKAAAKHRMRLACDFMMDWIYPRVTKVWAESEGLDPTGTTMTVNAAGKPAEAFGGVAVNPVHPAVRRRMVAFCEAIGERYGKFPAFAGIRHRFWLECNPNFAPWFLEDHYGYDDYTVGVFAKESGIDLKPVGLDQAAWDARRDALTNRHAKAWFAWRTEKCLSLQLEMLAALRKGAPNAVFFVNDRPSGKNSPWTAAKGLDAAAFRRHPELGMREGLVHVNDRGCEINGLDGLCYGGFNVRPAPYGNPDRGTNHWRVCSYPQGLCCSKSYRAHPYQLERPALALAENDLTAIVAGGEWCLPPPDPGLAAFAQVWRAIPVLDYRRFQVPGGTNASVAVWSRQTPEGLVFWAVNRTDRRLGLEIGLASRSRKVENLVDGGRSLLSKSVEVELDPYMPAIWRASGENAVASVRSKLELSEAWRRTYEFLLAKESAAAEMPWGGEYRAALEPVRAAATTGDAYALERAMEAFRGRSRAWMDVLGWPAAFDYGVRATGRGLHWNIEAVRKGHGMQTTVLTPYEDIRLTVHRIHPTRKDRVLCLAHLNRGVPLEVCFAGYMPSRTLTVTGYFGGGYGPIRVEQQGKVLGVIPGGECAVPRVETRTFPVLISPQPGMTGGTHVTLVGEGEAGLGIFMVKLQK